MTPDEALAQVLVEQKRIAARLDRVEAELKQQRAERAVPQSIDQADTVSVLRMACAERGIIPTADGRVGENDAAVILGKARQTLKNWRYYSARPLPHSKIGGTIMYSLVDIANWLEGGKNDT